MWIPIETASSSGTASVCSFTYSSDSCVVEEKTNMRTLYEIYMVNRKTFEVHNNLIVAKSEESALYEALYKAGVTPDDRDLWVCDVDEIMDVPDYEDEE